MPIIDINFDDVPDKVTPISAGIHVLDIKDVKDEESKLGEPITLVEFDVNEPDSPDNGRKAFHRFNFKYEMARILFKQMCKSAGLNPTGVGVESSDLIGLTVKASFKPRTYQDEAGETQETTNISKFHFEG